VELVVVELVVVLVLLVVDVDVVVLVVEVLVDVVVLVVEVVVVVGQFSKSEESINPTLVPPTTCGVHNGGFIPLVTGYCAVDGSV
jgi:hypothetical protein